MKNDLKLISPFKRMCVTIGNLPTAYLESMSYYECLTYLLKFLTNEVIPVVNNNSEVVKELQEYVNHYFDNLDVQEEINNKLDEMVEDGTLAEIINQEIFTEINESIQKIAYNNIFVGVFFDENEKVRFLTSIDGQNWSEFNKNVTINGRDPQLIYNKNNKTFYLSLTKSSGLTYDFICYTSTDFINWTENEVDLGIHSGVRWAPELFIDSDNTMYALISKGADTDSMQIYIARCSDIETLTFYNATQLDLNLENVIDPSLTKYNNLYYLTVKNENTSKQLLYTSSNLSTFSLLNNNIIGYDVPCEGGQLLNINDRWYFYGDTWHSYNNYGIMQTDDLNDFGYLLINKSLKKMRHGSVCYLNEKEAVNLITSIDDYSNVTRIINESSQILLSGTYDNLVIYPNYMYRINGTTVINKIENPYNLNFMPYVFTTNIDATLTITLANGRTQTIYNSTGTNEKLMIMNLQGDKYMMGRTVKNIELSDLCTINNTEFEVEFYTSKLIDNRLHLVFAITKLVNNADNQALEFKAPYTPVGVSTISNDQGINGLFIRNDGTLNGSDNLVKDQYTYCYCDYEIN